MAVPTHVSRSGRRGSALAATLLAAALVACGAEGAGDASPTSASPTEPVWPDEPAAAVVVDGEALALLEDPATDPAVGETIPAVSGTNLAGEPLVIGPGDGPMAIMIVAHWCPHCQAEVALLSDHLRVIGLPDDVRVVAISTAIDPSRENFPSAEWLANAEWPVATLIDDAEGTALRAFGVQAFPGLVLVGADGAVTLRVTGSLDGPTFDQALEVLREAG